MFKVIKSTKDGKPYHSDLIKAWADGKQIQRQVSEGVWEDDKHPDWSALNKYRVKPNDGHWKPFYKELYFFIELGEEIQSKKWEGSYADFQRLEIGNCFENREGAILAYNRVEAALKWNSSFPHVPAVPFRLDFELSDAEKSLIIAFRRAGVYAVEDDENISTTEHKIQFITFSPHYEDKLNLIAALKNIVTPDAD